MQKQTDKIHSISRITNAIEFRILLIFFALGSFLFPFLRYKNIEESWSVYTFTFLAWGLVIFILFLLSFVKENDNDGELE